VKFVTLNIPLCISYELLFVSQQLQTYEDCENLRLCSTDLSYTESVLTY
jgi:hypothetical protein